MTDHISPSDERDAWLAGLRAESLHAMARAVRANELVLVALAERRAGLGGDVLGTSTAAIEATRDALAANERVFECERGDANS